LQFTPNAGANGLVVAGYQFSGNTVVGNCSYYVATAGSGKGGRGTITYHYNTCTWDLYGNLISMTPLSSAPVAPAPLSQNGTETVYAVNGASTTGRDTRGFGFVDTPAPHYSWQTVNGSYAVIPYAVYTVTATLISDGDVPLEYAGATVTPSVFGFYTPTPGTATISATTCGSSVAVGTTCSITVSYNPRTIKCTGSPYGYAYTGLTLVPVTNSEGNTDFTIRFTVTGVPVCDD
jgi:hypothetical protein